jgi:sugar phosphate isomerase/epimerase
MGYKEFIVKIGLCTSVDQAATLARAGFDYVEENVQSFLLPEEPEAAFAPKLAAVQSAVLPVTAACCFLPGPLKCTGPAVDLGRIMRYADSAFRRARQAGIGIIVFGSGGSRQIPDGFNRATALDQFTALAQRLGPLAEQHGVTVVIEPLNAKECNFINSLAEGARIVEAAAHPRVRLLADIYHMLMDHEPAGEIITHGALIHHAHVAEREGRFAPGTGGEDFGPYLRALAKIGYRGSLNFECNWQHFPEQAAASVSGFREQVRQAGLG